PINLLKLCWLKRDRSHLLKIFASGRYCEMLLFMPEPIRIPKPFGARPHKASTGFRNGIRYWIGTHLWPSGLWAEKSTFLTIAWIVMLRPGSEIKRPSFGKESQVS